jgi:hypothetical protein
MQDRAKRWSASCVAYERRARCVFSYMVHAAVCMNEALETEVHGILPWLQLDVDCSGAIPKLHVLDIPLIDWRALGFH